MRKILIAIIILILIVIASIFIWKKYHPATSPIESIVSDYNNSNLDGAISNAEALIKKNPQDVTGLLALAATYAERGSVTFKEEENALKAIEYADMAIAIDPNSSEAYRIKGYAYEIQEKYNEAHANYDKAIKLNPANSQAISNKGHAYDLQGDIEKAAEWYKRALVVSPVNDHALLNLGRYYIRKNNFDEARITIDNVFSTTPNTRFKAEAYQLLARISYKEGDTESALSEIEESLQADPQVPQAWVTKAEIELSTALDVGDDDAALKDLITQVKQDINKALAINPNQTTAYIILSNIEIITGDEAAKKDYLNKALQAVELDITLGAVEKKELTDFLKSKIILKK